MIKINKRKLFVNIVFYALIISLGIFIFVKTTSYKTKSKFNSEEIIQMKNDLNISPKTIQDSIFTEIFNIRIEHPDIVYAQAVLETGNFQSKLFIEGNNCFGMKVPAQRPTLARSILYGHASFNTWKESIYDYAIWQSRYCKNLTREQYLNFLSKNYAECSEYVNKLLHIISKLGE